MQHIIDFTEATRTDGLTDRPAPARLIHGTPVFTTRNLAEHESGRLLAGRWTSTPGCWRVAYDEWEYMMILNGTGTLRGDDGHSIHLAPGVSLVVEPGFIGQFEVETELTKDYVILLPATPSE